MFIFPDDPPPVGQIVIVVLSNSVSLLAEWDGSQWWSHLNDNPDAAPLANSFVTMWDYE